MLSGLYRTIALSAALLMGRQAYAATDCEALFGSGMVGSRPELFTLVRKGSSVGWFRLNSRQPFKNATGLTLIFAATGAGSRSIYVLKTARLVQKGEAPSQSIRIARDPYVQPCGVFRWVQSRISNNSIDASVSVTRYLGYHKYSLPDDELFRFHLNYRDASRRCSSTDDKANGNIEQFLYGGDADRVRETAETLKNVVRQLRSLSDEAYASEAGQNSSLNNALMPYRKYSYMETRIVPNLDSSRVCNEFHLGDLKPGSKVMIDVNSLLERGGDNQRLPEREWQLTFE
jgi:hypothetical protein